ncbi:MAG: thiamine pyrophosphate-dependent dehydrogenase E1 component subunit alpha [Sphingomonadales bacterium]
MQLNRDDLIEAFRRMSVIREFEDRIHILNEKGVLPGFIHLSAGQEASAVAICMHLSDSDWIASTHRGHGHSLAKGCDVIGMMDEIYAKSTGLCRGKGGSMHIADLEKGMLGANGIVGAGVPLVAGAALRARVKRDGSVGVAFFGDGAYNEGATLETMNLAKVWNLPMVFALENNGYGEATPAEWAIGGDVLARAEGFGLPATEVDGHDFFAVYEAARGAIEAARDGQGPQFLHIRLSRYYGHFEGDAATYRPSDEVAKLRAEKDCLMLFRKKVTEAGLLSDESLDQVAAEVTDLIDEAQAHAEAAPSPSADDLETNVYASY